MKALTVCAVESLRRACGRRVVVILLIAISGCGGGAVQEPNRESVEHHETPTPSAMAPTVANPGYVGMESCVPCHRERVNEFRETRHFLAAVQPSQLTASPGFKPGKNRYHAPLTQRIFEMTREGQRFQMTMQNEASPEAQRLVTPIDMIYGHGAESDETYFSWQNDRVQELPVAWLHKDHCWGGVVINPYGHGDGSRPVTAQCLHCHFTWVECVPGDTPTFRRETAVWGVTCERCHGPGKDHVHYHKQHPNDRTPHGIVHPGEMSRDRLLDLCAQCHDNAIQFRRAPFTYRPGEVLSEFIRTPRFALEEDNHVANQNSGMLASRCFQQSETMTCITCHDPHHRRSADNAGSHSCLTCHQSHDCAEREQLPAALQNECVACHMPSVNKVQVNFRTEQDGYVPPARRWEHRIAVYPEARDRLKAEWLRTRPDSASQTQAAELTKSLAAFWLQRAEAYERETRFLLAIDAYRQALQFESSEKTRSQIQRLVEKQTAIDTNWFRCMHLVDAGQHREAINEIETLLEKQPRMTRARGRLGTLYAATGDHDRGISLLRQATEMDPNDSYSFGMLGWLAYLAQDYAEAHEWFTRATDLDARNPKLQYQMGLTLVALERLDEAQQVFRSILELNPSAVDACLALTHLEQDRGNHNDAIVWARTAVRLSQETDADVWLVLADCSIQARQIDEAKKALERALKLAEAQKNQPLIQRVKRKLETLRLR